jgi:hypothetical protein
MRQETSAHRLEESASDLQGIYNVFARVSKRICLNIMQGICNGFAMHTPGLCKAIAMGLCSESTAYAP